MKMMNDRRRQPTPVSDGTKPLKLTVTRCSACGRDHTVDFYRLDSGHPRAGVYTHSGTCPNRGVRIYLQRK